MKNILFTLYPITIDGNYNLIKYLSKKWGIILIIEGSQKDLSEDLYKRLSSIAKDIFFTDDIEYIKLYKYFYSLFVKKIKFSICQIMARNILIGIYKLIFGWAKKKLDIYNIQAVISHDDNSSCNFIGILSYAKNNKIKIIMPCRFQSYYYTSTIYHNKKYWEKSNLCTYQTKVHEKFSSKKYGTQKYKEHFFYLAWHMDALNIFDADSLSKDPFFLGCGICDVFILSNKRSFEYYKKNTKTCNLKKAKILGALEYDALFDTYKNKENLKEKYIKQYGLNNDKIIIYSLNPFYEHDSVDTFEKGCEYNEEVLAEICKIKNVNVVISLHPRMDYTDYKYLEEKYNCTLLPGRLMSYVSICDMLISSSSVAMWSIVCGIETIVIDFWYKGSIFKVFSDLDSPVFVSSKDTLVKTIKQQLQNRTDFSKDWDKLSRVDVFDGNVSKRYEMLIEEFHK